MTYQDQLQLFCFALGFVTGVACTMLVCLYINHWRNRELKRQGQLLIDKMIARKQVDFFFNETVRLFLLAGEAQSVGNYDLLGTLIQQHSNAAKRFEEAKLNYLQLEQQ